MYYIFLNESSATFHSNHLKPMLVDKYWKYLHKSIKLYEVEACCCRIMGVLEFKQISMCSPQQMAEQYYATNRGETINRFSAMGVLKEIKSHFPSSIS